MSLDYRPPVTRERMLRAIEEKRVVTADGASAPGWDIPKATVNYWAAKGWIKPALDSKPRVYLIDDLLELRERLAEVRPTRGAAGKFVRANQPR